MRTRNRSANAASDGSVGIEFDAPTHKRSGTVTTVLPRRKTRSLRIPSNVFKMAVDPRNTSSMKATSASGNM